MFEIGLLDVDYETLKEERTLLLPSRNLKSYIQSASSVENALEEYQLEYDSILVGPTVHTPPCMLYSRRQLPFEVYVWPEPLGQ